MATPPAAAVDGAGYLVPAGASGAWSGKAGQIAVWCNGGWIFLVPKAGWRAWDEEAGGTGCSTASAGWRMRSLSPPAARHAWRVLEFDHASRRGYEHDGGPIPSQAQVIGVTGRVTAAIGTGS